MSKANECWCGGEITLDQVCTESPYHDPQATGHKTKIVKIYIAGPMTGYPECNYPAFDKAEEELRALGYEPVNPAQISAGQRAHYVDYLREDLRALLDCDAVATLPGWEFSVGARNEVNVAGLLKMPVRPLRDWGPQPW